MRLQYPRKWQFSLATLIVILTVLPAAFIYLQPERPPKPLVPSTAIERHVLKLVENDTPSIAKAWVPISIRLESDGESYLVTYWTPRKELHLLGLRQARVNLQGNITYPPRE